MRLPGGYGCPASAPGGVAEWSIASVLKTEVGKLTVGSNPTPSVWGEVIR